MFYIRNCPLHYLFSKENSKRSLKLEELQITSKAYQNGLNENHMSHNHNKIVTQFSVKEVEDIPQIIDPEKDITGEMVILFRKQPQPTNVLTNCIREHH